MFREMGINECYPIKSILGKRSPGRPNDSAMMIEPDSCHRGYVDVCGQVAQDVTDYITVIEANMCVLLASISYGQRKTNA